MSKIAINNEIVLMRKAVRQSKVTIVRKLIKEAKLLQTRKHGDDKILEKCKRKAGKLLAEIAAIKKIKDDEIAKYGINETRKLQEILNDSTSEPSTRIMARLSFHNVLQDRIVKFKEKFPDYEQHLGPGRKKLSKLQRKSNRDARNALKKYTGASLEENVENVDEPVANEADDVSDESSDQEDADSEVTFDSVVNESTEAGNEDQVGDPSVKKVPTVDSDSGSILCVKTPSSKSKKIKNDGQVSTTESTNEVKPNNDPAIEQPKTTKPISEKSKEKRDGKKKSVLTIPTKSKNVRPVKVISKEATVKRFTDLVEDRESKEIIHEPDSSTNNRKSETNIEKQVDSFFMTENGDSEYMSVVVPKSKLCQDEEQDNRFGQHHAAKRQKNFHERNSKFFSKVDQRSDSGYSDKFGSNDARHRSNNNSNRGDVTENYSRRAGKGPSSNFQPEYEKKGNAQQDEELHPSWAARKKQQEILKQGFQGKKIVFGD